MAQKILLVGERDGVAQQFAERLRSEGYDVSVAGCAEAAELTAEEHGLCVACWRDRSDCPVEGMREYQKRNPQGYLVCCSEKSGLWERSLLLEAGVVPDVVLDGPAAEAVVAEVRRFLALEPDERGGEHLVLCIDDDDDFLASLEQCLPRRIGRRLPFDTVFEFMNKPADATALLNECRQNSRPVAMVLTDYQMPGQNGVELLTEAKQLVPLAQRVLLTGQAGLDDVVAAVNDRTLDHYISKPVDDLDQFAQTLTHLLNEYHLTERSRLESWQTGEQYQFLKNLARLRTLQETLAAVVRFVSSALDAERVSVMLCSGGRLTIRASVGLSPEVVQSTSLAVGEGIAGRVFQSGVPLHVQNRTEFGVPTPVDSPYAVFASVPMLVAPMSVANQPVGIINVTNRRADRPLTRREMMFLSHVSDAAAIAISNHQERELREESNFDTIRSLVLAVEAKDRYTRGHSERVALYSVQMAQKMGVGPDQIQIIERAAVIHDVGKIGVPEHVIHKPEPLTDEEFAHIKRHPAVGEHIISQLSFMAGGLSIVRNHHERLDGSGYPDGLRGEAIPLGARIVAVADAFDAMTSERPYRGSMRLEAATAELRRCSGTQFDPRCVDAFSRVLTDLQGSGMLPKPDGGGAGDGA